MALNLDTTFKLKAKVEGAKSVDNFKKQLKGLDTSSKMSKVQLGKMNIEINRMARAAGNTTKGLREHIKALTLLKERTVIGSKAYKRLGGEIDRLKKKLKGLDGQALSTGQKLAGVLGTVGLGRAVRGIVGGASSFEEETTKAAAIEGTGQKQAITEAVNRTAQIAAGTPQQVAELATSLARAGFDADQITGSLNGIVLGAEATQTAFSEMGSIVANNINAFGLEISDTEGLVDILVASANNANQTVTDLGESLKYAAPVAKTFGLTVNDTAATVGLLAQAGIKGSEAGTALRSGLSRLQIAATGAEGRLLGVSRGSQMLTKGFKALSSDILDANGNLKPMDEVLIALKRDFEGVTDAGQKAEIAKAIFGQEQGSKFLALLGRTEEDITSMFAAVRNSRDVAERTREAMASFGLTTKILGGNFEIVKNQIGSAFIAVLHPLAKLLNNILNVASRLPTPIKGLAAALAAAGLTAATVATGMIALKAAMGVGFINTFVVGLKAMSLGFIKAAGASLVFLATNPIGWAAIGVTLIIAFRKQLADLAKNIAKFVGDFIESKKQIVDNIMGIGKGFVKMINEFIIKTLNKLSKIPIIGKIFGTYLSGYQKIGEIVVDIKDKASETIKDAKEVIKEGVNKAGEVTSNVVTTVSQGASNILGGGDGTLSNDAEKTGAKHNQVLSGMKDALTDYQKKVNDVAGNVKNAMSNAFQGMEDALVNFVMTGKLAFSDLARSIIQDMARIVIQQSIMKPFTNFISGILPFGNGGVTAPINDIQSQVYTAANGAVMENNSMQKYAYGGIVSRPTTFAMSSGLGLMAEKGAEAIMPLKRHSNGKLGVEGGGGTTTVNVSVNAGNTTAQGNNPKAQQLGKMIGNAIQAELVKQKKPGGILYD